jgi:NitT/TauT family transport system permease protein
MADTHPMRESAPPTRGRDALRSVLDPVVFLVAVVSIWGLYTAATGIHRVLLPSPTDVVGVLTTRYPILISSALDTARIVLLGFVIGSLIGVASAVVVFYSDRLYRLTYYPMVALFVAPKVAFAPLFILWFGVNDFYRVLLTVLLVFFVVTENTLTGLRGVEREMLELTRSLKTSELRTLWTVRLPAASPFILAGLRLGIGEAFIGAVLAEMVAPQDGIGSRLIESALQSNTSLVFAGIVVIAAMGIALYFAAEWLERRLLFWYYP